jgi:phage shock protein PspC (stress-responsive transcriptional regulator)
MICGVATGLAERYGVPTAAVRVAFIAAFFASPFAILAYLLLTLSMPTEISVVGKMRLASSDRPRSPRVRFEQLSQLLVDRLLEQSSSRLLPGYLLSIWLLLFAVLLELPRIGSSGAYIAHSYAGTLIGNLALYGTPLFYLSIAALLLFDWKRSERSIALEVPTRKKFTCELGPAKMIGGVASGISEVLGLEPAYIRILFIVLNILTMGLAGAAYLMMWYLYKRKNEAAIEPVTIDDSYSPERSFHIFRICLTVLFIILAGAHSVTRSRLFFFNEASLQGLMMCLSGIAIVWSGLRTSHIHDKFWVAGGSLVFFSGVYELVSTIAHLQISTSEGFEVAEILIALSLAYFALVSLQDYARWLGLGLAGVFALSAILITTHFIPPIYLSELLRFYDFFYPLIFAGLGLWIVFDR